MEYEPVESFNSDTLDIVAEAIFTGILYGGSHGEWVSLPDDKTIYSKGMMRNGALDVLRALRTAGVHV